MPTRSELDALIAANLADGPVTKIKAVKLREVETAQADYTDQSVTAVSGGSIADAAVTNAKLANVATATFKARNTAGIGSPEDISVFQAKSLLGISNIDNTSDVNKPVSTAQAAQLNLKAPLDSPTFTGTPIVPTATSGTNTQQAASTAFVATAVAEVSGGGAVDDAFETLDYQASLTVVYNPLRPNKYIDLTAHGDISITNTATDSSSGGEYLIKQDTTSRTVTINGTTVTINPASGSKTLIQWWYDGTAYGFDANYSSASGGASLTGNNTFDGTNTFQGITTFNNTVQSKSVRLTGSDWNDIFTSDIAGMSENYLLCRNGSSVKPHSLLVGLETTAVVLSLRGADGQTEDIFRIQKNVSGTITTVASITKDGYLKVKTPTYADEAAATTAGLTSDTIYKTSTGELRIKL